MSARQLEVSLRWTKRLSIQRYLRLVQRLCFMSPAEVYCRLRLAIGKPYRQLQHRLVRELPVPGERIRYSAPTLQELSLRFDRWFFFGPSDRPELVRRLHEHCSGEVRQVVDLADRILGENVEIFGRQVRVAVGVDWQADPISGHRAWPDGPLDEAEAIGVTTADVKYVWELNRHQFLTVLGRAYWLTGDTRYADRAARLIDDWIGQNPPQRGVNWCSHLEVAMRAIAWVWTMPFLLEWRELDSNFLDRWLLSLAEHHQHLARNLSLFTDPTNHLIGEAKALWLLSVCFPEFPDAEVQAHRSRVVLLQELLRQNSEDGVNQEQASSYHRFVLDFYLQLLILAQRQDQPLPALHRQRIEAMLEFAAALAGERGEAPMIGDSDDARGVPLPEVTGWDFGDLLSTGAVLFQRPAWTRSARHLRQATLWLLGPQAVEDFAALRPPTQAQDSCVFPKGGYCFLRSTQAELVFDAGPLGLWPNAAHGHADALNVMLRAGGRWLLGDPGTGAYFADRFQRDALRGTAAHNTLTVDGLDQADAFDTFKWVNPMKVRLLSCQFIPGFTYAEAMHDGYARLRQPVYHYRSVLFVESARWIIVDRLEGRGQHRIASHFHFSPGMILSQVSPTEVSALDPVSGLRLHLRFPGLEANADQRLCLEIGMWSSRYGHVQPAPQLRVELTAVPPLSLITDLELERLGGTGASRRKTEHLAHGALLSRSVEYSGESGELLLVNPAERPLALPGGLESDARLVFLQQGSNGFVERLFVAGAGRRVWGPGFERRVGPREAGAGWVQDPGSPDSAETKQ